MSTGLHIPDVSELCVLDAALAYAEAGWYVGPLKGKHAGSVLKTGWHTKTSRDPAQIRRWFRNKSYGVFLHCGRSGAVAFDVDHPAHLPDLVMKAIDECDPPFQNSRSDEPARGHYVFLQPPDRILGNSTGGLGGAWGQVRGTNGIIVASPSEERYQWMQSGSVPLLPDYLSAELPDGLSADSAVSDAAVLAFLAEHVCNNRPAMLSRHVGRWNEKVARGDSRHDTMTGHLAGAMKDAAAGFYPADHAAHTLEALFLSAVSEDGHGNQGQARTDAEAAGEWRGMLSWAVAQAIGTNPKQHRAYVGQPAPEDEFEVWTEAPAEAQLRGDWLPLDVSAVLAGLVDGSFSRPAPTIGDFGSGGLFYPGRINSVHGESGCGKTWTALVACSQEMERGNSVVYIDLEDTPDGVLERLLGSLGVPADVLASQFLYLHPQEKPTPAEMTRLRNALQAAQPSLVVFDSTGEGLAMNGANPNADGEVAEWFRQVVRPLAECGAAVVLLDHITKAADNDLWPIGSQRKRAAVTGAAYLQKTARPFAQGQDGYAKLLCAKDRHGNYPIRKHVASLSVTCDVWGLDPGLQDGSGGQGPFRPTGLMEAVSRFLEGSDRQPSQNEIEQAIKGKHSAVREALRALIAEGYVATTTGPNRSTLHNSVRAYREVNDDFGGVPEGDKT